MNRQAMPNADFSSWTPLETIAFQLFAWASNQTTPPHDALVNVITENGETTFEILNE